MCEETVDILSASCSVPDVRLTFRKRERLRHRSAVTALFDRGDSEYAYPLRMFSLVLSAEQIRQMHHGYIPRNADTLQMMVTVPKKKFKHAVDRVWLRRRIREAYRLHRISLRDFLHAENEKSPGEERYMLLAFIYVGSEKREYASIEKKMVKLLEKAKSLLTPKEDKKDSVEPEEKSTSDTVRDEEV